MKKFYPLFAFLIICFTVARPQDATSFKPDSVKRTLQASQIFKSIHVDGILDEQEWLNAAVSTRFVMIEPHQGGEPNFTTRVKALFNRQFLYFGIYCQDTLGRKGIRATDFKRDFSIRQHDIISLSFDGFNDKRNAMTFVSNPYGVQRDLLSFDDIYYDLDWDGLWKVRTTRTDSGWYAEIAIPWQTLRYPRRTDSVQQWGFNAFRLRRLNNESSAFSAYPRSYTSTRMEYAGLISGLQPPPPKPNIRLQPFVLGSLDRFNGYDSSVNPKASNVKLGGDLKWAINPNAVLDLTVNTDFAQADADRQVNNVTRFSVFFPERRQFFLENASLFAPGVGPYDDLSGGSMRIQPFFSRRIGLDDFGNPIPIDAGGRFVYRSEKRNFGAMAIRQREQDESPAANFFVGRYSENFGQQNRIGALVTLKNQDGITNLVSAADGFFRLGEKHSLNTMVIHSSNSGKSGQQGMAGFAQYYYTNNQWRIWMTQTFVTKNFDPGIGFVSRSDVIGSTPGVFWYYRGNKLPLKKIIRAFEPGLMTEFYLQASTGRLIERQINFNPVWLNFQNGGYFGYLVNPTYQLLTDTFPPSSKIAIAPGEYNFVRHSIYASTDPSRIISLQANTDFGTFYNGKLWSGDLSLQFAPIPHVSILARFNRLHFKNVGAPQADDRIDLYSIQGRFALNPRLQLIGFYQRNTNNKSTNVNIRLSWEYQPLSYIYLVYNHRGFETLSARKLTEDHAIAKISYLRQL